MTPRTRCHRSQAGTTLVELLVATVIMGLALALLIGLFSTGVVESMNAKRDAAAQAAKEYELEKIGAMPYSAGAGGYSECFAGEGSGGGTVVAYQDACPAGAKVRADVNVSQLALDLQQWTVVINGWPVSAPIGKPVSTYKVNR